MSKYQVESKYVNGKEIYWISNENTLLLEPLSSSYLKHKSRINNSPNTVRTSAYAISYYLSFLDEKSLSVQDVFEMCYSAQFEHFSDYLYWLKAGRHCDRVKVPNNNTCNSYLAEAIRYLKYLLMDQDGKGGLKVLDEKDVYFINDAGVRFNRTVTNYKGYLNREEHKSREISEQNMIMLLEACRCRRDRLLLMLLGDTGMRIGELLGVDYTRDIDIKNRAIKVRMREGNENRARAKYSEYRDTFFSEKTAEMLQAYISENSEILSRTRYLFISLHGKTRGKAMNASAVYALLDRLEKRTGIKATPHMLRHYFAKERRKAGWDMLLIKEALGHRHLSTTERYLKISDEETEAAAEKYYAENEALFDIRDLL